MLPGVWRAGRSGVVYMVLVSWTEVVMPHHPLPKAKIFALPRGIQRRAGCYAMADPKPWILELETAENPIASGSW